MSSSEYLAQVERQHYELEKASQERRIQQLQLQVQECSKELESTKSDQTFLFTRFDGVTKELASCRDQWSKEKRQYEETIARLQAEATRLEERQMDMSEQMRESSLIARREILDLEATNARFEQIKQEYVEEIERLATELVSKQRDIVAQEEELSELKADKGHKRDASHLDQDRLEQTIADQLRTIGKLEITVSNQNKRLKSYTSDHEVVEILQEEKDDLKRQIEELKAALADSSSREIELLELRKEQNQWRLYLEQNMIKDITSTSTSTSSPQTSPVAVVKELMNLRVANASLQTRITELEQAAKHNSFTDAIKEELNRLAADKLELEEKLTYEKDEVARLKRENELQVKEMQLLRSDTKVLEQTTGNAVNSNSNSVIDATKINELESLVAQYKLETDTLRKQLAEREDNIIAQSPLRRQSRLLTGPGRFEEEKRQLVDEISKLRQDLASRTVRIEQLEQELAVWQQKAVQDQKTEFRILELRNNPTAKHEAIKQSTLDILRKENEALLEGRTSVPSVSLDRVRQEAQAVERQLQDADKRNMRLKEVFGKKSLEFLTIVNDLLGYKVEPQQNKKVRLISVFSPDQSLVINHSSKSQNSSYRGLEPGPLATELENHATFWLKERNCMPGFLAAATLELYEKSRTI